MIPFSVWFLINFLDAGSNIFPKALDFFFKRENNFVLRFIIHNSSVLPENNLQMCNRYCSPCNIKCMLHVLNYRVLKMSV